MFPGSALVSDDESQMAGKGLLAKFVSARCRRNAGEGAAGLSNQHAGSVRSPDH
jgi:hypothetical protein